MIPFVDLKKQYEIYGDELDSRIRQVCSSAAFILGPAVEQFEKNFASYLGVSDAVGVASGTDALRLSCEALGLGPGDEVLVPANTFIATAIGVHQAGAVPVPVDNDPDSYLMDLSAARKHLTGRTRALIPVHLYGRCLDMEAVGKFAAAHGLQVIEDACQAHGARLNGKRAGSFAPLGCFSFYPGKNLGAFGDGGLVATDDPSLAEKLRLLRNYGSTRKYIHELPGGNSRLDSVQAAVLDFKLQHLDEWNSKRFAAACLYSELLQGIGQVRPPVFDRDNPHSHVFHLFVIRCEKRDELLAFLGEKGIQCGIHYPVPLHLQKAFAHLGLGPGSYPVAEEAAGKILSLPMFPEITAEQVRAVAGTIKEFYG
ncbi:MAG: DegT/DnrJ/EryC1/StrS family aminotransferase [Candidatus Glassbacteria bacterium]|nr:DegT/DnrJ/EryC1/StrS family aminotransferase [Candidatus Glassbacteria bacterium]